MGLVHFCTSYKQRHLQLLFRALSLIVSIKQRDLEDRDSFSFWGREQACLPYNIIWITSSPGTEFRYVYLSPVIKDLDFLI